ncbi:hypothetical protein FH972_021361 [Carpinus fangiana]|uniref:Exocyst complex component SEC5 n=1 Tax=Carpinus fangiana TaxID=176857 RepID=A0A5N6KRA7_9ROSI|nr:hypothetical protein FH972_021361 [Carpinus fangiana]
MAEVERAILEHYNLSNLYPDEWPAEKNEAASSDDEDAGQTKRATKAKSMRHTRRFTTLERNPTKNSAASGGLNTGGVGSIVQKDEPDALGTSGSVVKVLRQRGLPVEDDLQLRNQFLLSSRTFNPTLFLSEVHNTASTESLLQGLDFLSRSIEKKSASLKVLVEENFERFVRAKATIDNVYREMRNHGSDITPENRPRSSRMSSHFRNASGGIQGLNASSEKKRRALVKESEFGVAGIKGPLLDATVKAEEVWGPALGGRAREEYLKQVLSSIEHNQAVFEAGMAIEDSIKRRDYDTLAIEFGRALKFAQDAKETADKAKQSGSPLTDPQAYQIIIVARVWMDVQNRLDEFKRDAWRRLANVHFGKDTNAPDAKSEEYMELISILLQLGVEDNPIWIWLLSRYDYLRSKISSTFERARVELEISRRKLASQPKPSNRVLATHLRATAATRREGKDADLDTKPVIQYWEHVCTVLDKLISPQTGILSEVVEFWDIIQAFVDGTKQRNLPMGVDGRSRDHHRLSRESIKDVRKGAVELFNLIREQVYGLFVEPPVEDVSALFTPIPQTPATPGSALSPTSGHVRFNFDPSTIPPLSPSAGEHWEKYAFWPPNSNSVSAAAYLSRINTAIGLAAAEIASLELIKQDSKLVQQLRSLMGDTRERSVTAICAAWLHDTENCRELEDWTRSPEKRDLTNLPAYFSAVETSLLSNLQKIIYLSEAANAPGAADIILPPPQRHIEAVQKGFKHSLYKAFSGMMEYAAKPIAGDSPLEGEELLLPINGEQRADSRVGAIDASNISVRKLLTMANFQALRNDIVPNLISQFESHFSISITDDAKMARDVLSQMSARVFQAYLRPTVDKLRSITAAGITQTSVDGSARPTDARAYVYDDLLILVLVHTEVSQTAPSLTGQILSFLLEQLSQAQIDAFQQRSNYTLGALMQATLDVEFLAQTLDNYTTQKASEIQSQIYLALDERTDNEARQRLQSALPELRAILKRLREKTKGEFGCFKRQRRAPKEPVAERT